jgi:hypothetical protein
VSLTGCPPVAEANPSQRAAERVELLALLWQVLDGDSAYCANPRLLMATRLVPELQSVPATVLLRSLREESSRDQLIKGLVVSVHGQSAPPEIAELADALDALSRRWDGLLEALAPPLTAAYREMRVRADPLAAGLDPATDLARITGEPDALEVVVLPSLFLPPPQNGRHSVLVDAPGEPAVAYLHYGFPLDDDPAQFGINAYWLLGGAWHYAVTRFIRRHWRAISDDLRAMPDVGAELAAALAEHRVEVAWPAIVAEHLNVALKCVMCAQARLPESIHRSFARTQGLALFGWFREWLAGLAREPGTFVAGFRELPRVLEARCDELVAVARATRSGPAAINFALASRQHRPVIVLPDHWDDALRERIGRRWSLVTGSLLGEREWRAADDRTDTSAIVFGEVGRDGLVDRLLASRELSLEPSNEGGEVLVSLFPGETVRQPWQIAIAVRDPEVAGHFAAENLMGLFHGTARFAGNRFVDGSGMLV